MIELVAHPDRGTFAYALIKPVRLPKLQHIRSYLVIVAWESTITFSCKLQLVIAPVVVRNQRIDPIRSHPMGLVNKLSHCMCISKRYPAFSSYHLLRPELQQFIANKAQTETLHFDQLIIASISSCKLHGLFFFFRARHHTLFSVMMPLLLHKILSIP